MTNIRFGLAGHTGVPAQAPYGDFPIEKQIALLKSLNMTVYRGLVCASDFGAPGSYGANKFVVFVDALLAAGIDLVVVLLPRPQDAADKAAAYKEGFRVGQNAANVLKGKDIKYWEIGNEWDLTCMVKPPGRLPSDYDTAKYNKCRGAVKGLMAGVRSVTATGQFLIGGAGIHWGYSLRLWQDGVRWDITKIHWYSGNDGSSTAIPGTSFRGGGAPNERFNIFQFLKDSFGRPICCTEFGVRGNLFNYDDKLMSDWLVKTMEGWASLADTYDFQFACLYEMLDEVDETAPNAKVHGVFRGDAGHVGEDKPQSIAIRSWMAGGAAGIQ